MEGIVARLAARAEEDPFAAKLAATLAAKSPTSMKIALRQMQEGGKLSFTEAMRMEYRIVSRLGAGSDFFEGVRAVIIDKDQRPRWAPDRLEEVTDAMVDAHFAPVHDDLPA